MLPEFFDHAQAENVCYLCVHRKTGGQDVSILTDIEKELKKKTLKFSTLFCDGSSHAKLSQ